VTPSPPLRALALLLFATALAGGCAAFAHGSYWPRYESRLAEGAVRRDEPGNVPAAAARAPATVADWSSPAEAERLRARLHTTVSRRWKDDDLVASARALDAGAGRWVYGGAMQTLAWFYVDPVTYGDLVVSGIESLRAALDDETFRAKFPEAADDTRRTRFAEALDILSLKARAARPVFSFQATEWLDVVMEKNRAMLGLPDGAVVAEFLFGATDALDPYTRFLTAEMYRGYRQQVQGRYSGIGASLAARDGRVLLDEVFEHGAAAEAGLAAGDELVSVDARPVAGLPPAAVSRMLRGKAGTKVTLVVRPAGGAELRTVTLTRMAIRLPTVRRVRMLEGEPGVGYLALTGFKSGTDKELRAAVARLADAGAEALLLDLRGNPGGSLWQAVAAAAVFLEDGRVLRTRGRAPGAGWTYNVPLFASQAWAGPLVVLVDEHTASAAEALAGALACRGRAVLVGRRTYGKGAAQVTLPIAASDCAICVTVARVYDPDDHCVEGTGLVPDVSVPAPAEAPASLADDPVVRAGVTALRAERVEASARR